jgi:acyl-CoA dehydrogenase
MSELRTQLIETAEKLLERGGDARAFEEAGFGLLLGDLGGDWGDAVAILARIGYHQPGLDVAEMIVGNATNDLALAAVALASGALQRCLDMSIEHANTRVQFGKPLGKQQAVQQSLALLAEEVAVVAVATQAAAVARDKGDAEFEIACAKLRTNRAIGMGTAIAHQVHGAIGFTQDYPLHHYTRALIGWRSRYGSEAHWAAHLGSVAAGLGGRGLWHELTRRSDA